MQSKRGFAKKGQEGMSMGTLGALLLVIVVVVLLILGLTGALNPIFEKFNLFPGSGIAGLVTACQGYVQVSSTSDFCQFRDVKVNGKVEYVNCLDARVSRDMTTETQGVLQCNNQVDLRLEKCVELVRKGTTGAIVDGSQCSDSQIACIGTDSKTLQGQEISSTDDCAPTNTKVDTSRTKKLTKGFSSAATGKACCVRP